MAITLRKFSPFPTIFGILTLFLFSLDALPDPMMMEVCDNAVDDDGDGLTDLNDPDCTCELIEPVSLIPNPSFEDLTCCPTERSQLNCAESWIQASEPTTDLIHRCDWLGWEDFPPPTPFPDGDGIMGFRDGRVIRNGELAEQNWKEYAGACLIQALEADSTYRFQFDLGFVNPQFSPPINVTFFGTEDCANLPFGIGQVELGCPTNGPNWIRLGASRVSGGTGNRWVNTSIEVTPEVDIAAIAIGPDCPGVPTSVSLYYFFDNLLLDDLRAFEFRIASVSHPCQPDFRLRIPENSSVSYLWYKDGVALLGETAAELSQMYGEGDYQVRVDDGVNCKVSVKYLHQVPTINTREDRTICKDEVYPFGGRMLGASGLYQHTFTSINNCDSTVFLNLEVLGALSDTTSARIFAGESYLYNDRQYWQEGDRVVPLTSSLGCDSLVLLQIEYYQVYIPNAFSPNGDGINDKFQIGSEDRLTQSVELTIYDRWGAEVAVGTEWDGMQRGVAVNPGLFLYVARVTMDDGVIRQFTGSVLVVK